MKKLLLIVSVLLLSGCVFPNVSSLIIMEPDPDPHTLWYVSLGYVWGYPSFYYYPYYSTYGRRYIYRSQRVPRRYVTKDRPVYREAVPVRKRKVDNTQRQRVRQRSKDQPTYNEQFKKKRRRP